MDVPTDSATSTNWLTPDISFQAWDILSDEALLNFEDTLENRHSIPLTTKRTHDTEANREAKCE